MRNCANAATRARSSGGSPANRGHIRSAARWAVDLSSSRGVTPAVLAAGRQVVCAQPCLANPGMVELNTRRRMSCRLLLILACLVFAARADDVLFRREVMAAVSKSGCNAGGCHGNGQ